MSSGTNGDLLILEGGWSDDLADTTSARPFMEAWADVRGIRSVSRSYHCRRDLGYWLREAFRSPDGPKTIYLAGHGRGRFLEGLFQEYDIDLGRVLKYARRTSRRNGPKRGLLIGACEVGKHLDLLLSVAGDRLGWAAGYDRTIPWIEATVCDLLFLEYLLVS